MLYSKMTTKELKKVKEQKFKEINECLESINCLKKDIDYDLESIKKIDYILNLKEEAKK